jgi:hypothetical protein
VWPFAIDDHHPNAPPSDHQRLQRLIPNLSRQMFCLIQCRVPSCPYVLDCVISISLLANKLGSDTCILYFDCSRDPLHIIPTLIVLPCQVNDIHFPHPFIAGVPLNHPTRHHSITLPTLRKQQLQFTACEPRVEHRI